MAVWVTAAPAGAATVQVLVNPDPPAAGARGLLVPGAGPTTSYGDALTALVLGRVRNSLLERAPVGPPLIHITAVPGSAVKITVGLPPAPLGTHPNDRRYPISIVGGGYEGVLESTSTRIPGLVSIADVAPTVLALERGEEPPLTSTRDDVDLGALDELIRDKNRARAPAMFLVAGLLVLLALVAPAAAVAALVLVLLGNVALGVFGVGETWQVLLAFAVAAVAAVPWAHFAELGAALAGVIGLYLLAFAVSGPVVALSPLGPTQNARFYGLSNLLSTLLVAAAIAGAALLARRYGPIAFAVVALAAFIVIAGNRFGADGGGAVVAAIGFGLLAMLLYGRRAAAVVVVAAVAVVLLDFATGGESHVTRAFEGGVFDDLARRLKLSWERATATWLDALYLGALLAALVALGVRARREPAALALAVALGVSLVVNDSPNEVLVPGVASLFALSRYRAEATP